MQAGRPGLIWSPQIVSDDSKFFTCVMKSGGYGIPQSKNGGYWYAYANSCFPVDMMYGVDCFASQVCTPTAVPFYICSSVCLSCFSLSLFCYMSIFIRQKQKLIQ